MSDNKEDCQGCEDSSFGGELDEEQCKSLQVEYNCNGFYKIRENKEKLQNVYERLFR